MNLRSRSQSVILKRGENIKHLPTAFTEHGILMLSSVLKSDRAVQVNIEIMRTFIRLRHMLASNTELARKLAGLERKYDSQFSVCSMRSRTGEAISIETQADRLSLETLVLVDRLEGDQASGGIESDAKWK